jgi:hypothetical protein
MGRSEVRKLTKVALVAAPILLGVAAFCGPPSALSR